MFVNFSINKNFKEIQMTKSALIILTILVPLVFADDSFGRLEVGMQAPEWIFKDADGNDFTMDTWSGKILQINYVDPDEAELNEPFNNELSKVVDAGRIVDTYCQGCNLISTDKFMGIGIVDCKATWIPDYLIKKIAGDKAEKFDTTILFDYDAELRKSWGLEKNSYNVIILDKDRVCRALIREKISDEKQEELIQLIIDLQNEI
jgi:hypothetical protein